MTTWKKAEALILNGLRNLNGQSQEDYIFDVIHSIVKENRLEAQKELLDEIECHFDLWHDTKGGIWNISNSENWEEFRIKTLGEKR